MIVKLVDKNDCVLYESATSLYTNYCKWTKC